MFFFPLSERFCNETRLGRFLQRMSTVGAIIGTPFYAFTELAYVQQEQASNHPIVRTIEVPTQEFNKEIATACNAGGKKWHEWVRVGLKSKGEVIPVTFPCYSKLTYTEKLEQVAVSAIEHLHR